MTATGLASGHGSTRQPAPRARPLVTVVVPVFNGGAEIVDNVSVIRRSIEEGLPGDEVELVVVSDGSIDGTSERLLKARGEERLRVIHYDRNLGKGYAVKVGALAAHGDWVAIVDSDLDLDPSLIPVYLNVARQEHLDLAIGSKRHPESVVHYPRSRRVMSWGYQQLNRVLFGLDVRDTQVGLKVFSRSVAEDVVPLLLVKRFAFDLELLAVANALGHRRVRELPVRLEYRFSGSGVGSRAVARALVDTAAIFYRLRVLRTYQRKRRLGALSRPEHPPFVSVVGAAETADTLDYPALEVADGVPAGELLAVVGPGARPAGNWVTAAVPFFSRPEVAAVVVPNLTPVDASPRQRAAAAVLESLLGGGSRRSAYFPGNVRVTSDYPTSSVVVRRGDWEAATAAGVAIDRLAEWLAERGRLTVYTPDSVIVSPPAPLFGPHLRSTIRHGRVRGVAARKTRGRSVSGATMISLVPASCAVVGGSLAAAGHRAGPPLVGLYAAAIVGSSALAAARFRSARVGLLAAAGLVATQVAYVAGFARGAIRGD